MVDFHCAVILIDTLSGVNLNGFTCVNKKEEMYVWFAFAENVEPHLTFSANAKSYAAVEIYIYTSVRECQYIVTSS